MKDLFSDQRIVMTLDAGGTNFVFSALQAGKEIIEAFRFPAYADEREKSLKTIIEGFSRVKAQLQTPPAAISFAFPGPADYPNGIIGDLSNLPAFSGGTALGPMLEEKFGLPVFINNDGDLFAYGEAVAGLLHEVNEELKKRDIPKRYSNLLGVTIGTGFGGGIVVNNQLLRGDNSASGEIWLGRNFEDADLIVEEGVSIRAIQHYYREFSGSKAEGLSPKDIADIAGGSRSGDTRAAIKAYEKMGVVLGEALAGAITLIDGLIVIGGGVSGAFELFLPKVIEQLNSTISNRKGKAFPRLVSNVHNLEDGPSANKFYSFIQEEIEVPFTGHKISYVPDKRLAVGISRLGTSRAIALGAYAFAINRL